MGPGARVRELLMFRHTEQFDAKPEKPDPEPLGGPGSAPAPDPKLGSTGSGRPASQPASISIDLPSRRLRTLSGSPVRRLPVYCPVP